MTNTALLVMDVQRDVVQLACSDDDGADYLPRLSRAIEAARASGIPVIYVVTGFRPGLPDVPSRNRPLTNALRAGLFTEGEPGSEIHPDVAPREGEAVVTKRRGSAFSGSDLDLVLRARGIEHLVLAGIATSGVVLHTLCRSNDQDTGLTVLKDACVDLDPELHVALVERLFPQWADVVDVDSWAKSVKAEASQGRTAM